MSQEIKVTAEELLVLLRDRIAEANQNLKASRRQHQMTYWYGVLEGLEQAVDLLIGRDPDARDPDDEEDE